MAGFCCTLFATPPPTGLLIARRRPQVSAFANANLGLKWQSPLILRTQKRGGRGVGEPLDKTRWSPLQAAPTQESAFDSSEKEIAGGPLYMGFDFGTSGARVMVIDENKVVCADGKQLYSDQHTTDSATMWKDALFHLIDELPRTLLSRVVAVSLDGTSATTMIIDVKTGSPVTRPLMYNESCQNGLAAIEGTAPANHTVLSGSSTLSKLVGWWLGKDSQSRDVVMMHQADWLLSLLHGKLGITDYNNALKVGYDPENEEYPTWLRSQPYSSLLPRVTKPGAVIGHIIPEIASRYSMRTDCQICTGTTDSIAAFLAAQVVEQGEAVTSLGSTLAVKLLSTIRVDDARYGVYSHRLGDKWLVGGASNTGGAVLQQLFSNKQIKELSSMMNPMQASPFDYYPLPGVGERFPEADPKMKPRLDPRPSSDVAYLHGILESIARIEGKAYAVLRELGATPLQAVFTSGGGAYNATWRKIRERILGVTVSVAPQTEAAYGAALLAFYGTKGRADLSPNPSEQTCVKSAV